ncbi:MAG: glutamine--tRNA ligase/YqeY domain fusion protein [Gemmatimonadetes bacterium]|nr:glutamine--tRNA ligase/YqeY domain fusion protein [Gemmatimonadota bacterium]
MATPTDEGAREKLHFIQRIVREHNASGRFDGRVCTRFPPEPNGYLHIGHAKSICINFGIAAEFGGKCNLRFDDTNPIKEEQEFVDSIVADVRWLGFEPAEILYASDYYGRMWAWAEELIEKGLAYVCDLTPDQVRETRGTLTEPGRESPHRNRSVAENLDLFRRMRSGEFPDGSRTLRAKIDMAAPNLNLRDPVMYRILTAHHHRTGDAWCVYPMYDWAHPLSDSVEGITHSLASIEFENHRPLYDWFLDSLGIYHPQQIEFARLELSHTLVTKRKLRALVEEGHVAGWDDPRMPTLAAMRRRGYPPAALRDFAARIGVAKDENLVEYALLEHCVREVLNREAPRFLGVLDPLRVVLTNWPEGKVEMLPAVNNPEDESAGTREIPFSGELLIEAADFMEDPPRKFFRLRPGGEVRLRWGYIIRCDEVVKDAAGKIVELRCTCDLDTRGGHAPDGRKIKGTIHWVSAAHAIPATVRQYGALFSVPEPGRVEDFRTVLAEDSLVEIADAWVEPALRDAEPGFAFQLERLGYYCVDRDRAADRLVLNRTATLRDTWAKIAAKGD